MRFSLLSAAIAASMLSTAAHSANDSATRLDAVEVTASRALQPLRVDLAASTVLDRAAIRASQAPDLIDLLARQAGVDVSRTGGPGSTSTLFLRGSNSNHTLVLIDGVRVNSAQQGLYDFAHLPLERIERIEIVRGPRAALWGSDAIGGVIQIFTRDPGQTALQLRAGSDARAEASGQFGWQGEAGSLGIGLGQAQTDGINATLPYAFGFNPDEDGYRNRNLSLAGRTTWGSQAIAGRLLRTLGRVEFDNGITDARGRQGGLTLAGPLNDRWQHQLSVGESAEDLLTASSFGNRFQSTRRQLDWLHDVALGGQQALLFGVNLADEDAHSLNTTGATVYRRDRDNTGLFAGWRGRHAAQRWELTARHDDSSQFGSTTTAAAAWGWQLSDGLDLRASWGQGFRAPSFNELYSPGFFGFFAGNSALRPERSINREVGLAWLGNERSVDLSIYRNDVVDLIAFSGINFGAVNIARATLEGVELGFAHGIGSWQIGGNVGWQNATNALTGQRLLRRADRKANLSVDWAASEAWSFGLDATAASQRVDFDRTHGGFTRWDLRTRWQAGERWSLAARVENLTNKAYVLASGFATPGRSLLLTLDWR